MSRYIQTHFKNHVFADGNFVSVASLIGVGKVNAIEARNENGELFVRSSTAPAETDTYEKNEIFKLNQETIRAGVKGFDVSNLEFAGAAGQKITIEYHV